jgi:hypothetical protein
MSTQIQSGMPIVLTEGYGLVGQPCAAARYI